MLTRSSQSTFMRRPARRTVAASLDPWTVGASWAAAEAQVRRRWGRRRRLRSMMLHGADARKAARPGLPWPTSRTARRSRGPDRGPPSCTACRSPGRCPASGSAPEYAVIGDQLREARLGRGLSLRALADRVGVSPSLISQVETGRARPSVEHALRDRRASSGSRSTSCCSPTRAGRGGRRRRGRGGASGSVRRGARRPPFEIRLPDEPVQRSGDRKVIRLASGVTWERLTTESIPNVDFLYVTYEVGGASSPEHEFQRHGGQEWGYVLGGSLGVTIGFDDVVLGPGDAIAFDSTTPHRLVQRGHRAGPRRLVRPRPAVRGVRAARRRRDRRPT